MKLPPLKNYYSAKDYLAALYEINKSSKKAFSHRAFAKRVKWPASFLSDVIKGRRHLTIARALQFASAFKMTAAETEYLIQMCLSEFEDANVSQYFKTVLKNRNLPKEQQISFKSYLSLFDNIRAMYLRELLLWGQGKVALKDLLAAQLPFPELNEKAVLQDTLNFLLKRKMIEEVSPGVFVVLENATFALDDLEFTVNSPEALANHYIHQLEILTRLYRQYRGLGFSFSGYIDFDKERGPEIQKRLFELRDWLISLSQEKKSSDISRNTALQVELHCLPLFDLAKVMPHIKK